MSVHLIKIDNRISKIKSEQDKNPPKTHVIVNWPRVLFPPKCCQTYNSYTLMERHSKVINSINNGNMWKDLLMSNLEETTWKGLKKCTGPNVAASGGSSGTTRDLGLGKRDRRMINERTRALHGVNLDLNNNNNEDIVVDVWGNSLQGSPGFPQQIYWWPDVPLNIDP